MTDDPNLVPMNSPEFYKPLPPGVSRVDFGRRSADQMSKDMNVAHDNIRKLVGEKDKQQETLLKQERELQYLRDSSGKKFLVAMLTGIIAIAVQAVVIWLGRVR